MALHTIQVDDRELTWLRDGLGSVLDALWDQREIEVPGSRDHIDASGMYEAAKDLAGRLNEVGEDC